MTSRIMFVDIYHGDTVVNITRARAFPLYGIIHKATQGAGYHDPLYATRRTMWKGLPSITWHAPDGKTQIDIPPLWGAYAFNTGESVRDQVANFLKYAQIDRWTLGAIDFEDHKQSEMSLAQLIEWTQRFADATGQLAKVYSGNRIKELITHATSDQRDWLARHDLWLCEYGSVARLTDVNGHPLPWEKYWAWQRDADGFGPDPHNVPGLAPDGIDQNAFDGTPEDLMETWVKKYNSLTS